MGENGGLMVGQHHDDVGKPGQVASRPKSVSRIEYKRPNGRHRFEVTVTSLDVRDRDHDPLGFLID
jgi:hypothetical protein